MNNFDLTSNVRKLIDQNPDIKDEVIWLLASQKKDFDNRNYYSHIVDLILENYFSPLSDDESHYVDGYLPVVFAYFTGFMRSKSGTINSSYINPEISLRDHIHKPK